MLEVSNTYYSSYWACATVHDGFDSVGSVCLYSLDMRR